MRAQVTVSLGGLLWDWMWIDPKASIRMPSHQWVIVDLIQVISKPMNMTTNRLKIDSALIAKEYQQ